MKAHTSEEQKERISQTRSRMDETIDALASRLNGRHLMDEVLGYFRSHRPDGNGSDSNDHHMRERVTDTASTAVRAVAGMVREHPIPAALIGAGVAWMLYERSRDDDDAAYYGYLDEEDDSQQLLFEEGYEAAPGRFGSEDEASRLERLQDEAREGVSGTREAVRERVSEARHRLGHARQRMRSQSGRMSRRSREMKRRARQMGDRAGSSVRDVYHQGRDQLDRHPLEAGFVSLATGIIAGLLTPNPRELDEMAGPAAHKLQDRVRRTAKDAMGRGKHVASVAVETARHEAAEQGLTPEAVKEGVGQVIEHTRHAAEETMREEADAQGLSPDALKEKAKAVVHETKEAARDTAKDETEEMGVEVRDGMSSGSGPKKDL